MTCYTIMEISITILIVSVTICVVSTMVAFTVESIRDWIKYKKKRNGPVV